MTRVRTRRNPLWAATSIEHRDESTKLAFMTVRRLKEPAAAVEEALRGRGSAVAG